MPRLPSCQIATSKQVGGRTVYDTSSPVPHAAGLNWTHPSILVVAIDKDNFAMATSSDLEVGTRLVVYGGTVFDSHQYDELTEELQHFPYQVAEDLYLGPKSLQEVGIGERLNHSCDPSAGFMGEITLVAIRDLLAGELITIDYAMCGSNSHHSYNIMCNCGTSTCRKILTGQDWKIPDLQNRLGNYFQPYLKRIINNTERC